jgi:hypothetical protein
MCTYMACSKGLGELTASGEESCRKRMVDSERPRKNVAGLTDLIVSFVRRHTK